MVDRDELAPLVARFREGMQAEARRARRRTWLLGGLIVLCCGYMSWLHHSVSKLDAEAVTALARSHVEAQLPELGDRLTEAAIDAAPELLDRGEAALRRAPQALRETVEARLLEETDALMDRLADELDRELGEALEQQLAAVRSAGDGPGSPSPDELMTELRALYRAKAGALLDELYVAYASEISGVDDFLVRLRDADDLSPRERAQREVIEASVALRRHLITPHMIDDPADLEEAEESAAVAPPAIATDAVKAVHHEAVLRTQGD